ncbi:MAG TPA: aldo/keto reductase [Phycisphaerales bacterium]|nr:aldo/keto reductase [Phycisphaerales bacterium]
MQDSNRRSFLLSTAALAAMAAAGRAVQPSTKPQPINKPEPKAMQPEPVLEKRKFGKTDMNVTVLGFGGAEIGFQQTDIDTVSKLLNSALDAGLNVIDTAECYAGSEESIGKAVSHRRKDFYLFTKVGHMDGYSAPDGWTRPSITKSIDRSLERLKTDHLDLVLLHSCGKDILEKGECIDALEEAKKAGKIRYMGYSGDTVHALYAIETGRFDALQTSVNIVDQECIDLTLPKARERNMGVIAKRPIANAVWRYDAKPDNGYVVEYWNRLQKLGYDFAKGDARSDQGAQGAAGTALRFTLAVPGVHVAIVGTTRPERWKSNAQMLHDGGTLPEEKFKAIRETWAKVNEGWTGQT